MLKCGAKNLYYTKSDDYYAHAGFTGTIGVRRTLNLVPAHEHLGQMFYN
jgi:hypothetical protein